MGVTLLSGYEANARNDLKDLDATNYLWTTAELDRHIGHAVNDVSRIAPQLAAITQTVTSDGSGFTYRQAISPLPSGYLYTIRVEYPIDNNPPAYLAFWEEIPGGGSLYLPVGDPPSAGDQVKFWVAEAHAVTNSASSIPTEIEELVSLGAVAYAAQAASRYAQNRLNASYWTPRGIQLFATERMAEYDKRRDELRAQMEWVGRGMVQWGDVPDDWQEL